MTMPQKRFWLDDPWIRVLQHLLFWVLSFYIFLQFFKAEVKAEKIDYVYTSLFHITLFPVVYLNLEWLLPNFANKRKWLAYAVLILIMIVLFSWLNFQFFERWSTRILPDYFFISYFTVWQVMEFFIVYVVITSLLKLSKSWFIVNELQRQLLQSEKQKIQIELKALRAQVNPHFFFNILNSIYSMALDKDERLPVTVLQLSDIMRYFLYESKEDFVPLEKELQVLQDYIALQKIRTDEKFVMEEKMEGEVKSEKVAPLLLITFLENAFKHGVKTGPENAFIKLFTRVQKCQLDFQVENNKGMIDKVDSGEYTGVGLENVKRRLELLYPGKHELIIHDLADRFVVHLQLKL